MKLEIYLLDTTLEFLERLGDRTDRCQPQRSKFKVMAPGCFSLLVQRGEETHIFFNPTCRIYLPVVVDNFYTPASFGPQNYISFSMIALL